MPGDRDREDDAALPDDVPGAPTESSDDGGNAVGGDGSDTEVAPDRAVLDRIVDGASAVLLVGPDGDELILPADRLPAGVAEGSWLELDLGTHPPTVVGIDQALTAARAADVSRRLDGLRRSRRGGRFDR